MCARIARTELLYDGCYGHVVSRSIRKLKIFRCKDDFERFKKLLLIEKRKTGLKVFHYCLMHTHFHLIVRIPEVNEFSKALMRLKSGYAMSFHEKYHLSGAIWRDRYKVQLIENEGYMLACGQYVECNPLRAGIVDLPKKWEFSSYRYYQNKQEDDLVDVCEDLARASTVTKEDLREEDFERGSIIGSAFFKYQFFDNRRRG
ncbi:MAG TPA: transposase [Candidatus Omnitrophota bacterium]|nr:transposase [Candidatus Omnitrophota bacterium]HPD85644.1 transposase [Candidatus Omnitrophota bacterium]HRZ04487.1 transposase [Candidatus Omnitrophota bacterium]